MIFVKVDLRNAKYAYRILRLDHYVFHLVIVSVCIKIIMGFFGRLLSFMQFLMFLIDCALNSLICLGLWFHYEENQRVYQIQRGYWVVVFGVSSFAISVFYYLSTMCSHKKLRYNLYIAIPMMLASTLITLKLIDALWLHSPMIWQVFLIAVLIEFIDIVYMAINSF